MPAKVRPDQINPTKVEQVAPGKFRFQKTVNDTTAGNELIQLHTLIKDWQDSDNLNAADFRTLTKRTMLVLLRGLLWVATRSGKGGAA